MIADLDYDNREVEFEEFLAATWMWPTKAF